MFRVLGFRGSGVQGLGFRSSGFWGGKGFKEFSEGPRPLLTKS